MPERPVRVGTRASRLALWQTEHVGAHQAVVDQVGGHRARAKQSALGDVHQRRLDHSAAER